MEKNEIAFCEYFEKEILPNRNRVNADHVKTAGALIGKNLITSCGSCLHNSAIDLLNYYNRILPAWNEYKKSLIVVPVIEKIIEPVASNEPTIEKLKEPIKNVNKKLPGN